METRLSRRTWNGGTLFITDTKCNTQSRGRERQGAAPTGLPSPDSVFFFPSGKGRFHTALLWGKRGMLSVLHGKHRKSHKKKHSDCYHGVYCLDVPVAVLKVVFIQRAHKHNNRRRKAVRH